MMVLMNMKILHQLWLLLYVTNDIPHVWHMLVANLEMNSYNQLGYRITKMYSSTSGFYAKCCQASSTYKALHDLWSHFIFG